MMSTTVGPPLTTKEIQALSFDDLVRHIGLTACAVHQLRQDADTIEQEHRDLQEEAFRRRNERLRREREAEAATQQTASDAPSPMASDPPPGTELTHSGQPA